MYTYYSEYLEIIVTMISKLTVASIVTADWYRMVSEASRTVQLARLSTHAVSRL